MKMETGSVCDSALGGYSWMEQCPVKRDSTAFLRYSLSFSSALRSRDNLLLTMHYNVSLWISGRLVRMDCAILFPCLFRDLPKSKDMVNTRSPFEEANSLFKEGVLQDGGYAFLYDLAK